MEAMLKEYKKAVKKSIYFEQMYKSSKNHRDALFKRMTTDMKCEQTIIKVLNDAHESNKTDKIIDDVLITAAHSGNMEAVQLCLDNNAKDPTPHRALMSAVSQNRVKIARHLMKCFDYPMERLRYATKFALRCNFFDMSSTIGLHIVEQRIGLSDAEDVTEGIITDEEID